MRGFTLASVIVLVIVVAVVAIASILLARTVQTAQAINAKAQRIAKNGRGINKSTDSVIQLNKTNDLARSILTSATPLQGQLAGIVGTANRINGLAGSINSTALRINSTASSINSSATNINAAATSINGSASSILTSAGSINNNAGSINNSAGSINNSARNVNTSVRSIRTNAKSILKTARVADVDVQLINRNIDVALGIVGSVKTDTGNILNQAVGAHDTAACIDFELFGASGLDGDCQGRVNGTAARSSASVRSAPGPAATGLTPEQQKQLDQLKGQKGAAPTGTPAPSIGVPAAPTPQTPGASSPSAPTDPLSPVLEGLGAAGNQTQQGSRQAAPASGVDTLLKQLVPGQ